MNENVFDLLETSNGIKRFNAGILEKYFDLSMCKNMFIKCVKVRNKDGKIFILRYEYYIETVNQKKNKVYENYIKNNYELV